MNLALFEHELGMAADRKSRKPMELLRILKTMEGVETVEK